LLVVAQQGKIRFPDRIGVIEIETRRDLCHPARRHVPRRAGRRTRPRLRLRELRRGFILAGPRADRRQLPRQSRDFLAPVAAYEDIDAPHTLYVKWGGESTNASGAVAARCRRLAWQLLSYNTTAALLAVGALLFDHPDPSIFTVLTSPSETPAPQHRLRDLPERWAVAENTRSPAAWYHRNIMSESWGSCSASMTPSRKASRPASACTIRCAARARHRRLRARQQAELKL